MCRFASFVLTRDQEVWIRDEDSHEVIIDHYKLHADAVDGVRVNILRVELVPPPEGVDPSDLAAWSYFVDQDIVPDWHEIDPDRSESRSRAALARRAAREGWFVSVTVGDGGTATAGYHGTATAGDGGTAVVGYHGTATAGDRGTATAGDRGAATAGMFGTATAGDRGTATAGDRGVVTVGDYGAATAGDDGEATAGRGGTALVGDRGAATAGDGGVATAGDCGVATAGDGGTLVFRRRACTVTAVVGEDGILPGVSYYMDAAGEIVRAP